MADEKTHMMLDEISRKFGSENVLLCGTVGNLLTTFRSHCYPAESSDAVRQTFHILNSSPPLKVSALTGTCHRLMTRARALLCINDPLDEQKSSLFSLMQRLAAQLSPFENLFYSYNMPSATEEVSAFENKLLYLVLRL